MESIATGEEPTGKPTAAAEKPKASRKLTVIGTVLVQLGVGSFYAWSVFNPAFAEQTGVKLPSISFTFTLGCFALSLSTLIAQPLVKRFGIKIVCAAMGILYGMAIMLLTTVRSSNLLALFWIFGGLILGASDGIAYITTLSNAIKSFPERTGLIAGVAVACYGLGSLIFKYVDQGVAGGGNITTDNLTRVVLVWGSIALVLIVGGALLIKDAPTQPIKSIESEADLEKTLDANADPDTLESNVNAAETHSAEFDDKNFSLGEMMRTYQAYLMFVCLFTACMFMGLLGSTVTSLAAKWTGEDATWASTNAATTFVAVVSIANTLGRFVMGSLSDIIGRKIIFFITYGATLVTVIVLLTNNTVHIAVLYLLIIVMAFCFGGNITVFPTFVGDYFGLKNHTRNYSIIYQGFGTGALAVGLIYANGNPLNPPKEGNFRAVLWTTLVLLIVSLIIFVILRKPKKKSK